MEIMSEILKGSNAEKFINEPIDDASLERILEAGRLAPSAKNRQPWRFIAVTRDSLKEQLKSHCYDDDRLTQAGAAILCCTTNIGYKMPNGQLSYPMDISFAACHMIFQARHEGLGAALLTTYQEPEIRSLFSVPYSMRTVVIVLVGKTEGERRLIDRHDSKRVISYNHW